MIKYSISAQKASSNDSIELRIPSWPSRPQPGRDLTVKKNYEKIELCNADRVNAASFFILRTYFFSAAALPENAQHVGGATLFGKGFGNDPQDIRMRMHYAGKDETE